MDYDKHSGLIKGEYERVKNALSAAKSVSLPERAGCLQKMHADTGLIA